MSTESERVEAILREAMRRREAEGFQIAQATFWCLDTDGAGKWCCAVGAVLPDERAEEISGRDRDDVLREVEFAALAADTLGICKDEVGAIIGGFDDCDNPPEKWTYPDFWEVGVRLRHEFIDRA